MGAVVVWWFEFKLGVEVLSEHVCGWPDGGRPRRRWVVTFGKVVG